MNPQMFDVDLDKNNSNKDSFTNWSNEPTVKDLKQDLTEAHTDVEAHKTKVDVWLDNLNITGKAKLPKNKGRSSIVPKLIRKQAEWRYSSLSEPFLITHDIFDVSPMTYEDKDAAIQNALVLNYQFNTKIDKVAFIDEYVRTAVDEGTVIVRVGWDYHEEVKSVEVNDYSWVPINQNNREVWEQVQQATILYKSSPGEFANLPEVLQKSVEGTMEQQLPVLAVLSGTHKENKTVVTKNCPTLEVCDYKNISIDPSAKGIIDNASFVSYSFESSLSELKKDGKYKNLDKIDLEGNSVLSEPDHASEDEGSFNFTDNSRKRIVVYEYWGFWDIEDNGILKPIVSAWVGDTMVRLEENPFPDQKVPFVIAQYLPVRKSMYGEPDGELLEDNQKVVGAVTRGMIDTMGRSANGQTGTRKDALDVTNKRKYDKGLDYEFNPQIDPRQAFYMHTYPEIPASASFMLGMQNAEAESLTGVKAFSGGSGITGDALGQSATLGKSALDATAKRELGILRRLSSGIKQIGRKIISMNAEFLSDVEIVRVTNEKFVEIRRDDLAGEFDLKLSISTPEADNAKAEELAFMLQTTGQTMGPAFSQIILADIARLRKMPELAKRIEDYTPQPDPAEQMIKELEIKKLQAEIEEIYSKTQENLAEANLDQAKAGNLQSDTDLKDLNFLEQESGTQQERALQKQGAQARANGELKILEHGLKERENRFAADTSNK